MSSEGTAERVYTGIWSILVRWFHVPRTPPTLPVGPDGHRESFKPAGSFLSYLKLWYWVVVIPVSLGAGAAWIALTAAKWWLGLLLLPPVLVVVLVLVAAGYIGLYLRYDTTWYVITERSLRIRRGAWIIHETTITFENVQNVKVQRGPIQRLFGIESVVVETAGGSAPDSKGGVSNRGVVEGLADAARIRDLVLARMRCSQGAGLGDEADAGRGTPGWTPEHLAVLREIRDEVAATV